MLNNKKNKQEKESTQDIKIIGLKQITLNIVWKIKSLSIQFIKFNIYNFLILCL